MRCVRVLGNWEFGGGGVALTPGGGVNTKIKWGIGVGAYSHARRLRSFRLIVKVKEKPAPFPVRAFVLGHRLGHRAS